MHFERMTVNKKLILANIISQGPCVLDFCFAMGL